MMINGNKLTYKFVIYIPLGLTPCMRLPSSRKAGGTGGKSDPMKGQGLYVLAENGNINMLAGEMFILT